MEKQCLWDPRCVLIVRSDSGVVVSRVTFLLKRVPERTEFEIRLDIDTIGVIGAIFESGKMIIGLKLTQYILDLEKEPPAGGEFKEIGNSGRRFYSFDRFRCVMRHSLFNTLLEDPEGVLIMVNVGMFMTPLPPDFVRVFLASLSPSFGGSLPVSIDLAIVGKVGGRQKKWNLMGYGVRTLFR